MELIVTNSAVEIIITVSVHCKNNCVRIQDLDLEKNSTAKEECIYCHEFSTNVFKHPNF